VREDLPTGTVTFLFTDIEGSTRLLQALGADYRDVLERHQALVRGALRAHEGVEVGTEGDSFFAVFRSATDAVAAASEAQLALAREQWPQERTVRVRMGLHTGEGRLGADNYIGMDVHRGARVAAAGHGGQVLVSSATRALVEGSLPNGLSLRDLGEHRLKDLEQPERVSQLVIAGLEVEFPQLRSLATPGNLPTELSSFIGRKDELAEIGSLLGATRLLTLIGPGGTGKTRLALQVGARMESVFADGVYFVDLAPLADPELVGPTIAHSLGLTDQGAGPIVDQLAAHLASREVLLVLDNFEHLLAGTETLSHLLAAAPRVKALVTSRTALNLYGEQTFDVPPLELPDMSALTDPAAISNNESVALFVDRARAASSSFRLTPENAPAVAEICVRLDGLPLAIELAASRVRLLEPAQILARLRQHLPALAEGPRNVPNRQRTLRGAIDWSVRLLETGIQALFARLAVFEGGCTLEAAGAVCNPGDELVLDTFDGLATLVDHSLLRRLDASGTSRFRMLETIHEYGRDALEADGDLDQIAGRHLAFYRDLAQTAETEHYFLGDDQQYWLDRFEHEHDNIRAALRWALETRAAEDGLVLAAAMWRFWLQRGYIREGRPVLEALLAMEPDRVSVARSKGYSALGGISYWQGDIEATELAYDSALDLARKLGDLDREAEALYDWAYLPVLRGNVAESIVRFEASIAFALRVNRPDVVAESQNSLGVMLSRIDQPEAAFAMLEQALVHARGGDRFQLEWTLGQVAQVEWVLGRYRDARMHQLESLRMNAEARNLPGLQASLSSIAALESLEGRHREAARLLGVSRTLSSKSGALAPQIFTQARDVEAGARKALGDPTFDSEQAEGARMTIEEAVAYVASLPVSAGSGLTSPSPGATGDAP
jgi:predicted ATPase/class 3 adenylate cyclase